MICDRIEFWRASNIYLPEPFTDGLQWLEEHRDDPLEPGRYDIAGDLYAMVYEGPTKPMVEWKFENHRKYADIHYIIAGRERIFWSKPQPSTECEPYSAEKDIEFFATEDPFGETSCLFMEPGMFAVFAPSDWHIPSITPCTALGEECENPNVVKIVVKVPIALAE